jgi:kumamolisin
MAPKPIPSLSVAEHEAVDLGPMPTKVPVSFTIALRGRDVSGLHALLDRGSKTSLVQWNSTFGPDPTRVASTRRVLSRAGLTSKWEPGDTLLSVAGPAESVEHFLHLSIHRFVLHGSTRFYAPLTQPHAPRVIASGVLAVTGANDYPSQPAAAIPHPGEGVTPAEMTKFYDLTPLRHAGIDGTGVTVMFPELTVPPTSALAAYAAKFHLPPFNVTVKSEPSQWGAPATPTSAAYSDEVAETAMDLEIVHGLAPGAREVVYEFGETGGFPQLFQAMTTENPGAILSSSMINPACEEGARAAALTINSVFARAAAAGTSIFWASGDRGAYMCLADGNPSTEGLLSVNPNSDSPYVTAVGGTTVFLASNGDYYKEAAWGEPLEAWGSGGGISTIYPQPSYQVAPGLGPKSLGGRGLPDVACDADDLVSGWAIMVPGQSGPVETPAGGTSASAPCWAAVTALIDEDLSQQGLAEVGFANPALYYFSRDPSGLPATPFHQVTEGSNFHFVATPGWNAATGLGTPDAAHLADDFEWYDHNHPGSG